MLKKYSMNRFSKFIFIINKKSFFGFLGIRIVIFLILMLSFLEIKKPIYSQESKFQVETYSEYIRNLPDINNYILGPGDIIKLKVSEEAIELDQIFQVNGEGVSNLKRLKNIFIKGLTIGELTSVLNNEYKKYVINPDVNLEIIEYRNIKVYIDGEVENPGMYILPGSFNPFGEIADQSIDNTNGIQQDFEKKNSSFQDFQNKNSSFPSLFDLIRKSQGITINANLEDVQVTRINPIIKGGGRVRTSLNILKTLNLEDISQNIRLYDGDTVFIPKSDLPATVQIGKAIKSNINPKFINVILQGRVNTPGTVKVPKGSTINDAITIGGGSKVIKGPIVLLRYNNDGTILRKKFRFQSSSTKGSEKNPFLKNGDIVYVSQSALIKSGEVLNEVTQPFQSIFSTWGFFKILFD